MWILDRLEYRFVGNNKEIALREYNVSKHLVYIQVSDQESANRKLSETTIIRLKWL